MNIVYKTTNTVNNKVYIGVHKTENISDGYIGCGVKSMADARAQSKASKNSAFPRAVLKYGYGAFSREILFNYNTYEEALEKEAELVTAEFIKSNKNYNCTVGGSARNTFACQTLERQAELRQESRQRSLTNTGIQSSQFQNWDKAKRDAMFKKRKPAKSKYIYIDDTGKEWDNLEDASKEFKITKSSVERRARCGRCGWSRRLR